MILPSFLKQSIIISCLVALFLNTKVHAVSNFVKYPQNPIFVPDGWSTLYTADPSLLYKDGLYRMWYEGHSGPGWKIGYASSINGIDNWNRNPDPVIPVGSADGWEDETVNPTVIYNSSLALYQMWYTSLDLAHWTNGNDRFRVRYATSIDGVNWTRYNGWILTGTLNNWDTGGIVRGLSVLYLNNVYHLWYAGTNQNELSSNPFWRIGYATSIDGINWTKQNNGNPVISPTESWELNNVSYPKVIHENSLFKMWYSAGSGDLPTQIVYATSIDGVNWTKPADQNPVLTRSTPFESIYLNSPSVLRISEDTLALWYSSYGSLNGTIAWRINYATSLTDPVSPTPTPTNTPTPTPTPTNTPTVTLTPSPTPSATTKVVVIPGMGGSWSEAILSCSLDTPGTWTRTPYYGDVYDPLKQAIDNQGYTVLPFYYDWRKPIPSHASALATFISSHTTVGEKVMLVGHSMGGLVGRAYLTNTGNNNVLDRFMTVGSPHRGTAPAYAALSGGELWTNDRNIRFVDTILKKWCGAKNNLTDREVYTNLVPSFYNILPIDDYLRDQKNGQFKPIASMSLKNNWLPGNIFTAPFFGVTVGALTGNGNQTIQNIEVKDPNKVDQFLGNWTDGKPTKKEKVNIGDGTVLASSSVIPGATNIQINQDHGGLMSSNEGISAILDFLGLGAPSLIPSEPVLEPESTLVVLAHPSWFWVTDPSGKTVNDTQGLIVIANPKNGTYKFRLIPKTFGKTRIAVGQFLKNGQILWKEYGHNGILPRFANITINQEAPLESPVNLP